MPNNMIQKIILYVVVIYMSIAKYVPILRHMFFHHIPVYYTTSFFILNLCLIIFYIVFLANFHFPMHRILILNWFSRQRKIAPWSNSHICLFKGRWTNDSAIFDQQLRCNLIELLFIWLTFLHRFWTRKCTGLKHSSDTPIFMSKVM